MREDILGGLKLAMSKAEPLKQAMMSFYNAGYKKQDIEASAKALLQLQMGQQPVQFQKPVQQKVQQPKKQIIKPKPIQPQQSIQKVSSYGQKPVSAKLNHYKKIRKGIDSAIDELKKIEFPEKQKQVQKVSNYEQQPSKVKDKLMLFLLIFILIILLGALTSLFIFKAEVTGFLNELFSV